MDTSGLSPRVQAQQITDALAHFVGGLVGEGDRQNGRARNPMDFHQMRHPMRDHARLAAAGAGQQQQRTFDVGNGGLLLRIETLEKIHAKGGRDLILAC